MARFDGRLRKLEARIRLNVEPSWGDYYAQASRVAEIALSSADRALLVEAFTLKSVRGHGALTEAHQLVWERWSGAFDKAVVDLKIPYSMCAGDAWL